LTRRKTLLKILHLAASNPFGISRQQLNRISSCLTNKEINLVRDSPYPRGLKGLTHEERIPTKGFYRTAWLITSAGRDWLRRLSIDANAMPIIPRGNPGFVSILARQYAAKLSRKAKRRKKHGWKRHSKGLGKYPAWQYDALPNDVNLLRADPNSPKFKALPALTRVQILRATVRRKQS
jgi:hypothetical protein